MNWSRLAQLLLVPIITKYIDQGVKSFTGWLHVRKLRKKNESIRKQTESASTREEKKAAAKRLFDRFNR